jgi:DNA-binding transcriptional LysR family regulator
MFLRDLSEYSLQSLRVFAYVASMGSVVEAADALGLTQPAVSLQIHNLEKLLGFHLFERQGRKNVLTSRGQALFQKLLPHLERLELILLNSKETEQSRPEIQLGSVEGIGEYWLWARFNDFNSKRKDLRLTLEIGEPERLEERLLTGRLQLIVTPSKFEHPQVVSQVLMDEKLAPVGKKKQITELKEALESRDESERVWEKIRWIGYGDTQMTDPWALRWLENVGIVVDRRFRYHHNLNSYAVIKQLLLEGAGICVAPEHTCEIELKNGTLAKLESKKYPALHNRLYISHREGSLTPLHEEFKDWLLKLGAKAVQPAG